MTKEQQIGFAGLIPLFLFAFAILILFVSSLISPSHNCIEDVEKYHINDACEATIEQTIIFLSLLGLLSLTAILPFFVKSKQKSIKRTEIKLNG